LGPGLCGEPGGVYRIGLVDARVRSAFGLLSTTGRVDAELPLRSAMARLAVEPDYAARSALGARVNEVSAGFDDARRDLLHARDDLEAGLSGIADPVARHEDEKGLDLRPILAAVDGAREASTAAFLAQRARWFPRLLGPDADPRPPSAHLAWIRRLSPLAGTYTRGGVTVEVLARDSTIILRSTARDHQQVLRAWRGDTLIADDGMSFGTKVVRRGKTAREPLNQAANLIYERVWEVEVFHSYRTKPSRSSTGGASPASPRGGRRLQPCWAACGPAPCQRPPWESPCIQRPSP